MGLALAREISKHHSDILVIDKNSTYGRGNSSRNSEVIHAGIYYPSDSMKGIHCVRGRRMLYEYCQEKNIPHQKIGKFIVAKDKNEQETLFKLLSQAKRNGLSKAELPYYLSGSEATSIEPELHCYGALFSPSTGIVDSHLLMQSLLTDAENNGVTFAFGTSVTKIENKDQLILTGRSQGELFDLTTERIIIAAGIETVEICVRSNIQTPKQRLVKGNYFNLQSTSPFAHLIYPLPNQDGLGIHLTLDLNKRAKFGPDTEYIQYENYSVNENSRQKFETAIRKFWPQLPDDSLVPGYAGIRPKLQMGSGLNSDFQILFKEDHGIENLVALTGVDSPGLTSCLSLADMIRSKMQL